MKIDTKYFGEIEIGDEKIIHFESGIMGFEEYKDFTILYDSEAEKKPFFSWLQCVTEKGLAFPVVNPLNVIKDYNPVVEEALLEPLGELKDEDIVLLVFATIPKDIKETSVNMKAPVIVNAANGKAIQVILEKGNYSIKHKIGGNMLALARKTNQSIMIGNDIEITLLEIKGDQVKIGINAPKSVPIYRKEIYVQIQDENKKASEGEIDVEALNKLFSGKA